MLVYLRKKFIAHARKKSALKTKIEYYEGLLRKYKFEYLKKHISEEEYRRKHISISEKLKELRAGKKKRKKPEKKKKASLQQIRLE